MINCGLENQAENSILEHCAACGSDGSKCLKKAVDDAGLVFERDGNALIVRFGGVWFGYIFGGEFKATDYTKLNNSQMLAIAERMG